MEKSKVSIGLRELDYCFYRNAPYETIIRTVVAEALLYGRAEIRNGKLKPKAGAGLRKFEKQIVEGIEPGGRADFHLSDFHRFIDAHIVQYRRERQSLTLPLLPILVFNPRFARRLKRAITSGQMNADLIAYIKSSDGKYLDSIDPRIRKTRLPAFRINKAEQNRYPYNRDSADVLHEATQNKHGIFRHWK